MDAFEYKSLWQKGQEDFALMDHNNVLSQKIREELEALVHFPEKSIEEIRAYQLEKIQKLVDYAFINIPLYKEKYGKVGYQIGDIKTFEDFHNLPLVYKEEIIDGFPNKLVKDINDFKYSTRSSGSSGRFLTVALDIDAIYTDTLQGIRQFIRQSNFEYRKEHIVLFIYTCPWWINNINGFYVQDFLPTTTDVKIALDYIRKIQPFIISTYPTYLQKFCELGINLKKYGVEYVIVHSEQSSKIIREEMGKNLGVKVLDEYSSEELTRIALECNEGMYHLEEDACYVEVLDPNTKEHIENGTGMLVGTNLLNKATPIIRYWQNDVVTIASSQKCACGNNGRVIMNIEGREMDCIISNGKKIPASAFMDLAYNWFLTNRISIMGLRYQIVQTSPFEIIVYLKKGIFKLSTEELNKIKNSLYTLVDEKINVKLVFTEEFIQNSIKFKPVLRLYE